MTDALPPASDSNSLRVSVIIPTYNHRDYVVQAIESVRRQTVTPVQIIVINDGSPDDTDAVLRPLADTGVIEYVRQANTGQAAARNRGLSLVRGEFVALLDDDDLWPEDHLAWQVPLLDANPHAVMVYGTHRKSTSSAEEAPAGNLPAVQGVAHFVDGCPPISPGQALFRTSAMRAVGGLDPNLRGTDDWDLYIRLARLGPILYQSKLALVYRVHAHNASKNFQAMFINGMKVVDKHFPAGGPETTQRAAAADFVTRMAAQIGIERTLELRRRREILPMIRILIQVLRIRPGLLAPSSLLRRLKVMKDGVA